MKRICGVLGCYEDFDTFIDHPTRGKRAVCEDHAEDYPLLDVGEGQP